MKKTRLYSNLFKGSHLHFRYITGRPDYWRLLNASTPLGSHKWEIFDEKILGICAKVWEAVRAILCCDTPEGMRIDEESDDLNAGSKDTLSYCWRALKESRFVNHSDVCF